MSDPKTIDEKNEVRTRTAAVEAGSIPEQSSNDEGRALDLQIEERDGSRGRRDETAVESHQKG
jgi:hypothetical protein